MWRQVKGIFQKILYVDLTKGLIGEEKLPPSWYRNFIGGHGVGMQYLLEDLKLRNPVLKDPIILMTGPLTGTPIPAASKASVISYRSNANLLKLSSIEGDFPAYLKLAGFDGLVLSGAAESPVRLVISGRKSRLEDASVYWGSDVLVTEASIRKEPADIATLAIGPAGEIGNPFAGIVADQFLISGFGLGMELGLKKIKHIAAEADAELTIHTQAEDFERDAIRYSKGQSSRVESGEGRRSCFGCVRCCGRYDPKEGFLIMEPDLEGLKAALPRLSRESRIRFYRECLKQGLDPLMSAQAMADLIAEDTLQESMTTLTGQRSESLGHCINTRSWAEAQMNLNHWYRDVLFRDVASIQDLVRKEGMAMVKNCLPLCEHWNMYEIDLLHFLNGVTGLDYRHGDLETIGTNLIRQIIGLYRDIHYREIEFNETDPCRSLLPIVLREKTRDYIHYRNWDETGYPPREH